MLKMQAMKPNYAEVIDGGILLYIILVSIVTRYGTLTKDPLPGDKKGRSTESNYL